MDKENKIIIVDEFDREIGIESKSIIHKSGILHRAFSILIFNNENKLLIQKRANNKYHSGGLWANTCCSHQKEKESLIDSTYNRLIEELGFDTNLREIFKFRYGVQFENGLAENEIDHVYIETYNGKITQSDAEIEDYKWISLNELFIEIEKNPQNYTYWFRLILERLKNINFNPKTNF